MSISTPESKHIVTSKRTIIHHSRRPGCFFIKTYVFMHLEMPLFHTIFIIFCYFSFPNFNNVIFKYFHECVWITVCLLSRVDISDILDLFIKIP